MASITRWLVSNAILELIHKLAMATLSAWIISAVTYLYVVMDIRIMSISFRSHLPDKATENNVTME
jgi:hypothetical protein